MPYSGVAPIKEELAASGQRIRSEGQVIARSTAMREILDLVRKIAGTDVPVLIQGEIGAGKQTIAREIHRHSPRAARPFVHVVCGSLRESDLEEKLFGQSWDGSRRGTGAPASLLESSQDGTLFLDGVTQLPLWAQVKLLDALQHSSGRNREDGVASRGGSPGDRLQHVRSGDCGGREPLLLRAVLLSECRSHRRSTAAAPPGRHSRAGGAFPGRGRVPALPSPGTSFRGVFPRKRGSLCLQYDWPGNVLQLAAVVAHAAMLAEGPEIGQACFAGLLGSVRQHADSETISVPLAGGLKDMELALINEVIRRCRGNKAAAARALKLHRRTLYRLLEE